MALASGTKLGPRLSRESAVSILCPTAFNALRFLKLFQCLEEPFVRASILLSCSQHRWLGSHIIRNGPHNLFDVNG